LTRKLAVIRSERAWDLAAGTAITDRFAEDVRRLAREACMQTPSPIATPRPYSPATLAERWACSSAKVRRMCRAGELAGFGLGRGIRIPAAEAERFEHAEREATSPGSEDASPSPDEKS
jgi:hypothetical protein